MKPISALMAFAAMVTLAGTSIRAEHPKSISGSQECATCAFGPHVDKVKHAKYASKEETFCLRKLPCFGWLFHGDPCPQCEEPRTKNRLVKWEVTEEKVKMKCSIDYKPLLMTPTIVEMTPMVIEPMPVEQIKPAR